MRILFPKVMKTVFISSFHAISSRNILATEIIPRLVAAGVRVAIVCPDYKDGYFKTTFGAPNVEVIGVSVGSKSYSRTNQFFKRLVRNMLDTETTRIRTKAKWKLDGKWVYYWFGFIPLSKLGNIRLVRRCIRWLDFHTATRRFRPLFDHDVPDLIFATDVQNENDVALLQEAKHRGIPTIGKVRSWDNLTQWGLIRVIPGIVMVPSEFARHEAIRFHDIPPERIRVCGIPHYDSYFRRETETHETFFQKYQLDPRKKLIAVAPVADFRLQKNTIDRFLLNFLSRLDANVWVRFPPTDPVSIGDFSPSPNMKFDRPGLAYDAALMIDRDITPEDDLRLRSLLRWCDLLISGPSTMAIDAAIFDRPVILINFVPGATDFWHGITEYRFNHIQHVLRSGGVRVVENETDLMKNIEMYLKNPERDRKGRSRLVREQCGRTDGRAASAVADEILKALNV